MWTSETLEQTISGHWHQPIFIHFRDCPQVATLAKRYLVFLVSPLPICSNPDVSWGGSLGKRNRMIYFCLSRFSKTRSTAAFAHSAQVLLEFRVSRLSRDSLSQGEETWVLSLCSIHNGSVTNAEGMRVQRVDRVRASLWSPTKHNRTA